MTPLTPQTNQELFDRFAQVPKLTRPTLAKLGELRRKFGNAARCNLFALSDSDAQYQSFLRLFSSERHTCEDLQLHLLHKLYTDCHTRCKGREVVAMCDTCEFNLTSLAGRAHDNDAATLGKLSDNRTKGLKAHVVFCVDEPSGRPLGIAHVFLYASGTPDADSPDANSPNADSPDADSSVGGSNNEAGEHLWRHRESARWSDSIAAALAWPLRDAKRATFVCDSEADQFMMLSQMFLRTEQQTAEQQTAEQQTVDQQASSPGPQVRWCVRMHHDRMVADANKGYWNPHLKRISTHLDIPQHLSCEQHTCLSLPRSGGRVSRNANLRIRSAQMGLRRPPGRHAKRCRGQEVPASADVTVTMLEEVDAQGQPYSVLTSKKRSQQAARTKTYPRLKWVLATNFAVESPGEQFDLIELYKRRWGIELFFRLLKSDGADMERTCVRRVARWQCLLIIAMDQVLDADKLVAIRHDVDRPGEQEFTHEQMRILEADDYARCHPANYGPAGRVYRSPNKQPSGTVAWYAYQVGIMGGLHGNAKSPPGRKRMARGLRKLQDRISAARVMKLYDERDQKV